MKELPKEELNQLKSSSAEGRVEGIAEGRVESAQKLLELGKLTNEEIAQVTGLTIEQIEEMAKGA